MLFLSSGNIHRSYNSKSTDHGQGRPAPPPLVGRALSGRIHRHHRFAPLCTLYQRIHHRQQRLSSRGDALVGALFLISLAIIFIGMALTVLPMVMGDIPEESEATSYRDSLLTVGPPLALLLLVFPARDLDSGAADGPPAGRGRPAGGAPMKDLLYAMHNGASVPLAEIPPADDDRFFQGMLDAIDRRLAGFLVLRDAERQRAPSCTAFSPPRPMG